MKRFVSMALATVMSLCLAVPAFAAEAIPDCAVEAVPAVTAGEEVIMPRVSLLTQNLDATNTAKSSKVTANAEDGDYIRFYYKIDTASRCTVYLMMEDGDSWEVASSMRIDKNGEKHSVFYIAGAGSKTYYIKVENTEDGGAVLGTVSLAQYTKHPEL